MRRLTAMEEWLKKLNDEVKLLYHHLDLYKKLNKIISNNEQLRKMDNTIPAWMRRAFSLDLVVGMCRICDTDTRTASFVRFLYELKDKTEYLQRERYIKLYSKSALDEANEDFDSLAGRNAQSFPIQEIQSDIYKITKGEPFNKIRTIRNKYLAHTDKIKVKILVKYDEIFDAFEILEKIMIKYNILIHAISFSGLTPQIDGDWEEVFTIPWIVQRHNEVEENGK